MMTAESTTVPAAVATPEHDKLAAVRDLSEAGGELLEWLTSNGYVLCRRPDDPGEAGYQHYLPVYEHIETILARWLGIDLTEIEREKRAILAHLRAQQERADVVAALELAASPLTPPQVT